MHRYKMRAEAVFDVTSWLSHHAPRSAIFMRSITWLWEAGAPLGDVEVLFESNLDLDALLSSLEAVEEGHVMVETLALEASYTGERKYDRSRTRKMS